MLLLLVVVTGLSYADDTVYPPGYNITCRYQLSDTLLDLGDTVLITRTLVNHEFFPLSGLFLSENLSPTFDQVSHSTRLNGVTINLTFVDDVADEIVTGYESYYWLIDEPDNPAGAHDTLFAGDSLTTVIALQCTETGTFILPFHSVAFYGNSTSFFATDDTLSVRVQLSSDVEEPGDDQLLPSRFLTSHGYPNPFNGSVRIYFAGENLAGKQLTLVVRNLLGQRIEEQTIRVTGETGELSWTPATHLSSGVYFYELSVPGTVNTGKLVLVK